MASILQWPAEEAAKQRAVEQAIEQLKADVQRLLTLLAQARNQVGNLPIDPDTVAP